MDSFNVIPFSLLKMSNKIVIKFCYQIDDVINFKIYLGSTCKAMADMEKKREDKYKNLNTENDKNF